ncbi:MAG: hypothetical protein N3D10_03335 [Candidatus Micrarchaeota archaeon]|nr:hypothetical protein [Candidatus Micrarchaeota archaeon]
MQVGPVPTVSKTRTTQTTRTSFEQFKKDLSSIDSWTLAPSSFSDGLSIKFSEYGNSNQAKILIKILSKH